MRFPQYEWVGSTSGAGGAYRHPNAPWRAVLHSIEGIPSDIRGLARTHSVPPHFWVDPYNKIAVQSVDTSSPAWALHHPYGIDTNHMHALQWEIAGYANNLHALTADQRQWLADMMAPVVEHYGVDPLNAVPQKGVAESYGKDSSTRFTDAAWIRFDGICGHQNVPTNDHWDPGTLDLQDIARRMGTGIPEPIQEDDMFEEGDSQRLERIEGFVRDAVNALIPEGKAAMRPAKPEYGVAVDTVPDYWRWVRETVLDTRELVDRDPVDIADAVVEVGPEFASDVADEIIRELARRIGDEA